MLKLRGRTDVAAFDAIEWERRHSVLRYLRAADFSPRDHTWRLVEWCAGRGLDEFSLAFRSAESPADAFIDAIETRLEPFSRGKAERTLLSVPFGEPQIQSTKIWAYSPDSLAILRHLFADGLFEYPIGPFPDAWVEDAVFYRDGALMMGIVSHEREGVMDLSELEWAEFSALGFRCHERGRWI